MGKICCFAGHSNIYDTDNIKKKLDALIEKLIIEENVSEFWVGAYGDFDYISASSIRKLKERYPDIKLNLVIPYLTQRISGRAFSYNEKYDNIFVAEIPPKTPKKFYISKCNEYMVQNSCFMICYVKNTWGGAVKTLEYAQRKKHIKIFNLSEKYLY